MCPIKEKDHLHRNVFLLSQFPKTQPWVITLAVDRSFTQRTNTPGSSSLGEEGRGHVRCDRTCTRRSLNKDKSHENLLPKFYSTYYPARISDCFGLESLQATWLPSSKISLGKRIEEFRKKLLLKHTSTQVQIKPCPAPAHKPSVHTCALKNTTCVKPGRKCWISTAPACVHSQVSPTLSCIIKDQEQWCVFHSSCLYIYILLEIKPSRNVGMTSHYSSAFWYSVSISVLTPDSFLPHCLLLWHN